MMIASLHLLAVSNSKLCVYQITYAGLDYPPSFLPPQPEVKLTGVWIEQMANTVNLSAYVY